MSVNVEKALELIYKNSSVKSTKILPIEQALGFVLAQDVTATYNLPSYDNSAMDGYAVMVADGGSCVKVTTTIFAGDNSNIELHHGEAVKIMTGARIPLGTQCIVPVEDTQKCEDGVLLPKNLVLSKHIRFSGEDIKIGTKILCSGERLNAHQITLLASQGISHIKVYKKPKIAIFGSGNELKMHFETVESHQLYNTNTPTFFSRVKELGCEVDFIGTAKDTLDGLKEYIESALDNSDMIITSGGVSVGDADFTKEAFNSFGYEIFFDKIEIKPGKPTTVGKIGKTMILNLPGNPLAASLNFELFGQSMILAMSGEKTKYISSIKAKMKDDFKLRAGRRNLVPGLFDGEFFRPCDKFAPGMVSPLGSANAYIMIDENCGLLEKNSMVNVISTKFMFTTENKNDLVSGR